VATPEVPTDAGVGRPTPSGNALPAVVTGATTGGPRDSGFGVASVALLAVLLAALLGALGWVLYRLRRSRARAASPNGVASSPNGVASAQAGTDDPVDLFAPRSIPPDRPAGS
jgi:hypothetical protein